MSRRTIAAGLAVALLVAGCGLKGPLFLPEKSGDVTIRPGPQDGVKPSAPPTATTPTPTPTPPPTPEAEPATEPEAPRGDGGG